MAIVLTPAHPPWYHVLWLLAPTVVLSFLWIAGGRLVPLGLIFSVCECGAILYSNIRMLSDAVALKEAYGDADGAAFLKEDSPVGWHHINSPWAICL